MSKKRRNIAILAFVIFLSYVGSYAVLSLCGQYWWSGTDVNVAEWQPRFVTLILQVEVHSIQGLAEAPPKSEPPYVIKANALGYFYFPLIILDRGLIHKNKITIDQCLQRENGARSAEN
jgi:hypothetical protein